MPSVTLPCHMSLFHSVDPDRHGITTNGYVPQVRPIKGMFDQFVDCPMLTTIKLKDPIDPKRMLKEREKSDPGGVGCYIATCVYGAYDCPEVWTLRRFRDNVLAETVLGRAFVRVYYALSPSLVKWFGETRWFQAFWRGFLNKMVKSLQSRGVESTPYEDKKW